MLKFEAQKITGKKMKTQGILCQLDCGNPVSRVFPILVLDLTELDELD